MLNGEVIEGESGVKSYLLPLSPEMKKYQLVVVDLIKNHRYKFKVL